MIFSNNKLIITLFLLIGIGLIQGCEDPMSSNGKINILEIASISIDPETIEIENTAKVNATIVYSGNTDNLIYQWSATGGRINGNTNNVVYVAPKTAGTYTIELTVTDNKISDSKQIAIEVTSGPVVNWGG